MARSEITGPVICAWCEAELKRGNLKSPLSHGICLSCMATAAGDPIEDLSQVQPELLDALPFGAIQLAGDGTIVAYNRSESALSGLTPERVVGKNFFFETSRLALRSRNSSGGSKPCVPRMKMAAPKCGSSLNSLAAQNS